MQCPECNATYTREESYCPGCGADLPTSSTGIVPFQQKLPSVLYNPQVPRGVAASVGAVALGVGLELLRRNVLFRMKRPAHRLDDTLPTLNGLKDLLFPKRDRSLRPPRGYEVHETVIIMRRVIRRQG